VTVTHVCRRSMRRIGRQGTRWPRSSDIRSVSVRRFHRFFIYIICKESTETHLKLLHALNPSKGM